MQLSCDVRLPCNMQVYPPIKLKKANMRLDRLAGKVVTGVGSAAKSARRIVSRIGSAPDGMATPQQVKLVTKLVGGRGQAAEHVNTIFMLTKAPADRADARIHAVCCATCFMTPPKLPPSCACRMQQAAAQTPMCGWYMCRPMQRA